jgi:tetratricopeptide (TPR) repeat protein
LFDEPLVSIQDLVRDPSRPIERIPRDLTINTINRLPDASFLALALLAVAERPTDRWRVAAALSNFKLDARPDQAIAALVAHRLATWDRVEEKLSVHALDREVALSELAARQQSPSPAELALALADQFDNQELHGASNLADVETAIGVFDLLVAAGDGQRATRHLSLLDVPLLLPWGYARLVLDLRSRIDAAGLDDVERCRHLRVVAQCNRDLGNFEATLDVLSELRRLAATVDRESYLWSTQQLSGTYRRMADFTRAEEFGEEALTLATAGESLAAVARARIDLGRISWCMGDYGRARDQATAALSDARQSNDPSCIAYSLALRGAISLSSGFARLAVRAYDEALTIFTRLADVQGVTFILQELAYLALLSGDLARAVTFGKRCLDQMSGTHDLRGVGHMSFILARAYRQSGDLAAARDAASAAYHNLATAKVPEGATALAYLASIESELQHAPYRSIELLIQCAMLPPNTGDVRDSIDIALDAAERARHFAFSDLRDRALVFAKSRGLSASKVRFSPGADRAG